MRKKIPRRCQVAIQPDELVWRTHLAYLRGLPFFNMLSNTSGNILNICDKTLSNPACISQNLFDCWVHRSKAGIGEWGFRCIQPKCCKSGSNWNHSQISLIELLMSKMGSGKKDQEGAHQQGWGYFHWEPCLGKNACSRPKTPEGISKGYDDKKSPFSIQAKIKGHLDSPGISWVLSRRRVFRDNNDNKIGSKVQVSKGAFASLGGSFLFGPATNFRAFASQPQGWQQEQQYTWKPRVCNSSRKQCSLLREPQRLQPFVQSSLEPSLRNQRRVDPPPFSEERCRNFGASRL